MIDLVASDKQREFGLNKLRSLPQARLVYTPEGATFRLNWLVDLDLSAPSGAWRARVDALSGQVVGRIDAVKTAAEIVQDTVNGFYAAVSDLAAHYSA